MKHIKTRNTLFIIFSIFATANLVATSATPAVEDLQADEKCKIFQQFSAFQARIDKTTNPDNPERRAKLLQWAPTLMRDIVTGTFTQHDDQISRTVEDYRKVVSCAASWPYYITHENNHDVLKWMTWAAQFADTMHKNAHRDELRPDDFRCAAGLHHSIGVRRESKTHLANAEKYFDLLLHRFNTIVASDYANAANTQMSLAHLNEPEQRKHHYTKALNLMNRAMELINGSPVELLHMHLPFAKDLCALAKRAGTKYTSAKPLRMKFEAYVANIELKINEQAPPIAWESLNSTPSPVSSLPQTPAPSPSPTAQTEGPTPDADSMSTIEVKEREVQQSDYEQGNCQLM